ncbi:hypothetical protein IV38_GL000507 [Lactobacillus selangorensis]|uniref:UPF0291 protein IV38_GL000507 n=1 Tax=Lactobacillus selangorensis TaxID=81857 RepID=A0A0R2FXH2_9LACO|nr:DUF896 domain-containing protein [Lactobacillus selangorensis]KRN29620.1 hypothetical protein IV38_GL000507 [Lactobacillus selangorensis]KRN33850.1 hypothetical protein IV40_GL000161 [Lactobacillus selangorensis]
MAEQPQARLDRINALAKKAKTTEGLTNDEKKEQAKLRKEYLADFRAGFKQQIEDLRVFDKNGKEVTSDKVKKIQRDRKLRND